MKKLHGIQKQSVKKQWFTLYCLVLLIPMLVTFFSYRISYNLLADAIYEQQYAHLNLVRDIVDTEIRNIQNSMLSLSSDMQIRKAIEIKNWVEEKQRPLFNSIKDSIHNVATNQTLVKHYSLFFPESDYLIIDNATIPRHVLGYNEYTGTPREVDLQTIIAQAQSSALRLMKDSGDNLLLYMKLPVYGTKKTLYVAATLSGSELNRVLNGGLNSQESIIGLEAADDLMYSSGQTINADIHYQTEDQWFFAEVDSDVLPMRYFYASPVSIVEKELISYRYLLITFALAGLLLGLISARFAVQHQYAPIKRLMERFSSNDQKLANEYSNISEYLQQVEERNDHHFMTDMLLGNIDDNLAFPYVQLLLLTHADGQSTFHLDPDAVHRMIPNAKIVSLYEHTVILIQKNKLTDPQIVQTIETLKNDTAVYIISVSNEGQSVHQAYTEAMDMLSALRFFNASNQPVYHTKAAAHDPALQIMDSGLENSIRSAIFARNQAHAAAMMQEALSDMQDKCHSGSLLRGSLYAISLMFIRLEAAIQTQNVRVPDGVSGEAARSYRHTSIEQLREVCVQAIHDMVAALDMQDEKKGSALHEQIDAYIQSNYQNPDLNVDMIAESIGFSAVYLRRVYKQSRGASITDTILKVRINAAKELLTNSATKVGDVASQIGFWDVGTFIRSFKKLEGITPGTYRNQFRPDSQNAPADDSDFSNEK